LFHWQNAAPPWTCDQPHLQMRTHYVKGVYDCIDVFLYSAHLAAILLYMCQVEQCKSAELASTAETKLFYQLQPATRVTVTSPAIDAGTTAGIVQPAASPMQAHLSGLPLLQSVVAAQGFAGYHTEVTEALSVAALGLGLSHLLRDAPTHVHDTSLATDAHAPPLPPTSPSKIAPTSAVARDLMRPPKGLILYGPPGTGKTILMHAIVAALRCNYLEMSHSLLLSR
jgi:hypothetical protein